MAVTPFFSHMILQKSFYYSELALKKHFLLSSMKKTVVLLNIFVKTVTYFRNRRF